MGLWEDVKSTTKKAATKYNPLAGTVNATKSLVKGDPVGAVKDFGAGMTFGGSDIAEKKVVDPIVSGASDALYKPYGDAAAANEKAGGELEKLGTDTYEMSQKGIGRALDQTTPAARFWNRTYEGEGSLATPGALEQRYADESQGLGKSFSRSLDEGTRRLGDLFAAKGLSNSGAAIRGNQEMIDQAVADREGRLDALSAGAQGAAETRLGGAFDRLSGLGMGRAGLVAGGTEAGISNYAAGKLGGINANLAAADTKLQARRDLYNTIGTVGGAGVGAYFGGPAGGAAGAKLGGALAPRRQPAYDPDAPLPMSRT